MSRWRGFGTRYPGGRIAPGPARNSTPPSVRPTNVLGLKVVAAGGACGRGAVCGFVLVRGVL